MVSKTPLKTFSQKFTHEKMANRLIYKMYSYYACIMQTTGMNDYEPSEIN